MNYDVFKTEMVSKLQDLVGRRYFVSVQLSRRAEKQPEDFLMVFDTEDMAMMRTEFAPIYEVHEKHHVPMDILTSVIRNGFHIDDDSSSIDKGQVFYRLESLEHVQKEYHDIPYQRFLDLAIVFYRKIAITEDSIQSRRITNRMMHQANLSVSDLMNLANKNTPKMFPHTLRDFDEVALELLDHYPEAIEDPEVQFGIMCLFGKAMGLISEKDLVSRYVLSCKGNLYGSTAILYPNLLKNIGEKLQSDFYILPCSKNEAVIEAISEGTSLEELKREAQEAVKDVLDEPAVLTTSIYRYDRANGSLSIVG